MKRATPGTKSKKATTARKPASPRNRPRAKTKTAKAKKVSAPKTKSRPAAQRKKTAAPAKRLAKKPTPGVRPSSGAAARRTKVARKVSAARKLKVAAPKNARTQVRPRAKLQIARKPKVATRVTATKALRKISPHKPTRVSKPILPAFLLEGDEPSFLTEAGAAEKFALGPSAPPDQFDEGNAPLPSSYGTRKLFLTARDPHWLYAHWDFSHEEQFRHNARSEDRHLILRLHDESKPEKYAAEIHVHPESKHWFVHVDAAGTYYSTELGYYRAGHKWKSLATSEPMRTPPDNISTDSTVEFATIPLELSFETMLALLKEHAGDDSRQNLPLARAIEMIHPLICEDLPGAMHVADWTTDQEQTLAEILAAAGDGISLPSSQDSPHRKTVAGDEPLFVDSSYASSFFGCTGLED